MASVINSHNVPGGGASVTGELMVRCVNKGTTAIVANSLETDVVIDTLEYVSPGRDIVVVGIKNKSEVTDGATRPRINVQVSNGIAVGATGEGHVHGRISVLGTNSGSKWYLDENMAFADTGSFVIGGSVTIGTINYYLIERLGGGGGEAVDTAIIVGSTESPDGKSLYLNDCQYSSQCGAWLKTVTGSTTQKNINWPIAIAGPTIVDPNGNYSNLYIQGVVHYPAHGFTKPQILTIQYDSYSNSYSAILTPQAKSTVIGVNQRVVLIPRGPDDFYFDGIIPGTMLPGTLDTGKMYAKNASDNEMVQRMDPELGIAASGGGRLKVFTDPNKQVDIVQAGQVQATRSGTVFDYLHVNVITSSPTVPTGAGVKGQIHIIY
jgi:hypothetical protein